MNWIAENWESALEILGGVVALATAIVKVTPTHADNKVLDSVLAFIDKFSLLPDRR